MRLRRTLALAAFAALAAAGISAAPASAAITSIFASNTLTVTGDGANDTAVIDCIGLQVKVNGADPDTGALSCGNPTQNIAVNGGGDFLEIVSPPGVTEFTAIGTTTIDGGEGPDEIRGSWIGHAEFVGTLLGGPGDDFLFKGGNGIVRGGPDNDRLDGLGGEGQTFDGGEGSDEVVIDVSTGNQTQLTLTPEDSGLSAQFSGGPPGFGPWTSIERFDALLNDGPQTVDAGGFSGTVRVNGLGGADTLIGGPGPDELSGGAGNDTFDGSGGADQFFGDSGDDLLRARDGVADGGDCGPGADTLIADTIDVLSACETVELPAFGADTLVKLKLASNRISAKGPVAVVVSNANGFPVSGELSGKTAKRAAANGKRTRSKLKAKSFEVAASAKKTVKLNLPKALRPLLQREGKLALRVTGKVRDPAGNTRTVTKKVKLRLK